LAGEPEATSLNPVCVDEMKTFPEVERLGLGHNLKEMSFLIKYKQLQCVLSIFLNNSVVMCKDKKNLKH
jgi:hypothetical protein